MQPNTPRTGVTDSLSRNAWISGFTPQAEIWNGRLAMIGFVSAIAIELYTHQGILHFWGILSSGKSPVL